MALPGELPDGRVPMFLVTGFLGSGKTTLLNHLLARPEMAGTAVLINEFGEIGIDNLLVSEVRGELLLLASGCVCCQYLGELADTVKDLFAKREAGEIPRFNRIVLETTGLADPVRLVDTAMNDPSMSLLVYLDSVIVTVDALLALDELREHPESIKQIALADRVVLTKTDAAPDEEQQAVRRALAQLNPSAPVLTAVLGSVEPEAVLGAGTLDDGSRGMRVQEWLWADRATAALAPGAFDPRHGAIRSFLVRLEPPLDFPAFASWFASLTRAEGTRILRVKGLLRTLDDERPLVVQSVQWILCPTHRLPSWPDADRSSRIVFIAKDLPPAREAEIRAELDALASDSARLEQARTTRAELPIPAAAAPPAAAPRITPWQRLARVLGRR